MDGVRKIFHVNVDLSKLFDKTSGTNFIMLIDETKMTIVYEFIEWIRWMFSLKECIYVTHENSIIHELEDVRILEALKKIELKPCNAVDCFHEEMHNNLLRNINFFVHWNQMKVPKIFVEKLTQINQKQHFMNQKANSLIESGEVQSMKENNFNNKCTCSLNDKTVDFYNQLNGEHSTLEDFCNNDTESCQSDKSFGNVKPKFFNGNECHKSEFDVKKNVEVEQPKSNENNFSNNTPSEKKLNSSNADSLVKENLSEIKETTKYLKTDANKKNVKSNSHLKRNKTSRPFSLAEFVDDLRNKSANQTVKVTSISLEDSSSILKEENEKKNKLFSDSFTGESPCIKKRRKRVRKSKSKKKKETDFEPIFHEQKSISNNELISFPPKVKTNHIRFHSTSEEDEVSNELKENEAVKNVPNIQENIKKYEMNQNSKVNLCELLSATSEEKQVLSSADKYSSGKNIAMECMPIESNETCCGNESILLGDKNSELLHDNTNQFYMGTENNANYHSFSDEITSLKNKFPTPVIFERFY